TLGTIEPFDTVVLKVVGRIDPSATTASLVNTATFTSTSSDPDPADDTAVTDTPPTQSADLAATQTAARDTAPAGDHAVFNVTVTNDGPSTARDVSLLDTLPDGTALVSIEPTPEAPCDGTACTFGDVLPGQSVSAVVTVRVPPSQPAGTITNVVTAA